MIGDRAYDPVAIAGTVDDPSAYADPVRVLRSRLNVVADQLSLAAHPIVM
jgi:hypothetical protein